MAGPGDNAITIIKRKKAAAAAGHHGGAWKVAYADFVTAMMAFFLLMWLLNATTEEQRKGIAEYFDPRTPIARISGGGVGVLSGDTIFAEKTLAQSGTGATRERPSEEKQATGTTGAEPGEGPRAADGARAAEDDAFAAIESLFQGKSGESELADELLSHIRTRVTDEGLVIEIFDRDGAALFASGSAEPSPQLEILLRMVGEVAAMVANRVAVTGHTDAAPFSRKGYSNWELSADRANAARRVLAEAGIGADRFARVVGKAATEPAAPRFPMDARNRRIAVTLLRSDITAGDR